MPQARKAKEADAPARYAIVASWWDENESAQQRNLGCPHYEECLHEANAELLRAAKAYKARSRAKGKVKRGERVADGTHTWVCRAECPYRQARDAYHLALRKPTAPE